MQTNPAAVLNQLVVREGSPQYTPPNNPVPSTQSELKNDENTSDSDIRRVPDIPGNAGASSSRTVQTHGVRASIKIKKRGGASADKEYKRLKRLLRNRVSAQQARERKKAYVNDLEARAKELELRNAELEENVSTLQRENFMLRQVLKNTTTAISHGTPS